MDGKRSQKACLWRLSKVWTPYTFKPQDVLFF